MANKYGRKGAPLERRKEICEFYENHTQMETLKHFGISADTLFKYRKQFGYAQKPHGLPKFEDTFKHEVCQYYEHHTGEETAAKYGITKASLCKWRSELGYRNKHRGFNLYTEGMQPAVSKRVRRNFQITRSENGELKAKVADLEYKLSAMELVVTQTLYGLTEEIKSTLEAFDL